MRVIIFTTVFLTVFALINLYISKRFISHLNLNKTIKRYLNIFLLVNYVGIIGYMYVRYNPDVPNSLYFLLSLPIGVVFLLFCTAIFYDISHLLLRQTPLQTKRREFFKNSLDIGSLGLAFGLSARAIWEAKHIELKTVDIKIENLNTSYKIVQLSDIHIGGLIDEKFIANMVKTVNQQNPDLVVITGDMIDISLPHAAKALNELKNLRSKYGTYFIVGNHEYFHGIEEIIQSVKDLGITVLENSSVYIGKDKEGFNLCGVYDLMGQRLEHHIPDLNLALEKTTQNRPVILLAHQPKFIEEFSGGVDLMLSGHTHGGQIYPFRALVKLQQPYLAGLYRHDDRLQVYVNKGTGFWGPPMRLGATSEITVLNIS